MSFLKIFVFFVWRNFPARYQKRFSELFSVFFKSPFSKIIIAPYCLFFSLDSSYLDQFEPESGADRYSSYEDFFKRKFKALPSPSSNLVWPCEGYLCENESMSTENAVLIKGQMVLKSRIFGSAIIPKHYQFFNIFLHNHNYHRIHAPLSGVITSIEKIPGELQFLRPWLYSQEKVSEPAIRNERVIVKIKAQDPRLEDVYMAIVGGFGVGTICLPENIKIGAVVHVGQEIGQFLLGSTVCMAMPGNYPQMKYLELVSVNKKIDFS